jgi:hypothetical protein
MVAVDAHSDIQSDLLRQMTPARRLKVAESLYWQSRALKAASLKAFHPDWTEEQIKTEVRKLFLYVTTD